MKTFNKSKYNRLCAEFLDNWSDTGLEPAYYVKNGKGYRLSELLFDSDWNWIMEVVEKIESLENYYIQIEEQVCYIYDITKFDNIQTNAFIISDNKHNSKKEAVVQAIWEFLNWYEKHK